MNKNKSTIGLEMYFEPKIVEKFAELEQNEKNFAVADLADQIIIKAISKISSPLRVAELGAGAHPDRYHRLFKLLLENNGKIAWVDISPLMLKQAKKYLNYEEYKKRLGIIDFVESDIISYLIEIPDKSLDLAIMKYVLDHFADPDELFYLLSKKIKKGGVLVSNIGKINPELTSHSTNAQNFFNNKAISPNKSINLSDGDAFTIKFFKISGDPKSGHLKGAQTTKFYHHPFTLQNLAKNHDFDCFQGTASEYLKLLDQKNSSLSEHFLVLTKK